MLHPRGNYGRIFCQNSDCYIYLPFDRCIISNCMCGKRKRTETGPQPGKKSDILRKACETENDDLDREALRRVVPTFKKPEEVNAAADRAEEMKNQREPAAV